MPAFGSLLGLPRVMGPSETYKVEDREESYNATEFCNFIIPDIASEIALTRANILFILRVILMFNVFLLTIDLKMGVNV